MQTPSTPFGLQAKQFWPTTFFYRLWDQHSQEASGIIQFLYEKKISAEKNIVSGIAPQAKSATGLFESDFDLFACDHPGLNKLKAFIGKTVQMVVAQVNGPHLDPRKIRVLVPDSWFHITNDGGFHDSHTHRGCSWCGIYYLQVGDTRPSQQAGAPNGGTRFYSPFQTGALFNDLGNQYLDKSYVDPPIGDGMLLLFPAYLAHSALPYAGKQDRIVIAFNTQSTLVSG